MDGMNFTRWKEKMKFLLTAFKRIHSEYPDRLYDLYTPMTSAKEIWNSLEEKYTAEKEGADKFITFKFFEFAMKDNVSILDQVHEFLILDFTLDQIQKHLRIEEETRIREKNLNGASSSKVNYVDSGKNNKGNNKKMKGTWNSSKDNKKDKKPLYEELHMASVTTTDDWWYDSGPTTHVFNNRDLFKTYKETEDGHEVMMGDNHTSKVIGSGNVEIQFTSGKKLTLMNVLHVPNIRKDLVSGFKLCKSGVKAVIESDKVIISKANVFIGKAYACDDLESNVIVESRDVDFFEIKFRHDSTSTNKIVTQIPQDISGPNLNSFNKRNMAESSSAPRGSERARKKRNLDPDFIDSQAIIFLVEGDNENNVVNKIPFLLNVEDAPKTYKEAITSRNFAF
nr:retrovirus-related Pol polyprotein from transposon TNT 1-94 [Tanacetum cinerariifolium]